MKEVTLLIPETNVGIINTSGNWIVKAEYEKIYPPVSQFSRVKKDKQWFFLNAQTLKTLLGPYKNAQDFQADHAIVVDGDKNKIINSTGSSIYESNGNLKPGGEGHWIEYTGDKCRMLKEDGSVLTDVNYDDFFQFKNGVAGFRKGEAWGYINDTGLEIVSPSLPIIWDCNESMIRFIGQTGYGYFDKAGQIKVIPKYAEARDFVNGYARVAE